MKTGRIIGSLLILLIIGFFIIPIGINKNKHYEESVKIQTDPISIYSKIDALKHWPDWLFISENDKNILFEIDSSNNSSYLIYSKSTGYKTGRIEIISKIPYQSISFDLNIKHFGMYTGKFSIEPEVNFTTLRLNCDANDLKYPFGRWKGLFLPLILSKPFKKNLRNINNVVMN
jgi:hypothetical protein